MRHEMVDFIKEHSSIAYEVMDETSCKGLYRGVIKFIQLTSLSCQEAEDAIRWFQWYNMDEFKEEYENIKKEYPELML